MGCDGGTIPRRDELVRMKKKPEQKEKEAELHCKWQLCALSQERLQPPIVACELGRLYNKDALIEALLDRATLPDWAKHLRNLKDVKTLNLTPNPTYKEDLADKGDVYIDRQAARYVCPVIGQEMNGRFNFCFLWTCGCVVSQRALKEIKTSLCHKCQQPFSEENVVILNPANGDLDLMEERMETRRAKAKTAKKNQKGEGKRSRQEIPAIATDSGEGPSTSKKAKEDLPNGTGKLVKNGKINGTFQLKSRPGESSKGSAPYSVSEDPHASEVYKSIFTSHDTATNQPKAHWITYNPFYN